MFCFLTSPCSHTWPGERLRGQEGAVERWRDAGMQGCTEGCGRHWWLSPPPGVLWPLIPPQRPRTPPAPPPCCRVTVGGCGLGLATPAGYHQRREAAALLVLTKLELNKSCVAAGVTTTPVNCDLPRFNCTSCVVIPEFIISVCICVCLCCST